MLTAGKEATIGEGAFCRSSPGSPEPERTGVSRERGARSKGAEPKEAVSLKVTLDEWPETVGIATSGRIKNDLI